MLTWWLYLVPLPMEHLPINSISSNNSPLWMDFSWTPTLPEWNPTCPDSPLSFNCSKPTLSHRCFKTGWSNISSKLPQAPVLIATMVKAWWSCHRLSIKCRSVVRKVIPSSWGTHCHSNSKWGCHRCHQEVAMGEHHRYFSLRVAEVETTISRW